VKRTDYADFGALTNQRGLIISGYREMIRKKLIRETDNATLRNVKLQ
jgi:hypothetical protein